MLKRLVALSILCASASSCRTSQSSSGVQSENPTPGTPPAAPAGPVVTTTFDPYENLDTRLGEKVAENEIPVTQKIAGAIMSFVQKGGEAGSKDEKGRSLFLRDAHPKAHGCVKGDFKVLENVPADLKKGLFAQSGKSYKAWIRYSNGSATIKDDKALDARGMALKVTGVEGAKIEPSLPEQTAQDFVLTNHPIFFVDDPVTYLKFLGGGPAALPPQSQKIIQGFVNTLPKNVLRETYWSAVPYRLGTGDTAIATKVAAIPVPCDNMSLPSSRDAQQKKIASLRADNRMTEADMKDPRFGHGNYLRETMAKYLSNTDACFLLGVQRAVDEKKTPVEDSSVNWDDVSAFTPVAQLRVPKQKFDSDAQDNFCQNLSFSPWNALLEHKPLGTPNRIRFSVYKAVSELRRKANKVTPEGLQGPTGNESF